MGKREEIDYAYETGIASANAATIFMREMMATFLSDGLISVCTNPSIASSNSGESR